MELCLLLRLRPLRRLKSSLKHSLANKVCKLLGVLVNVERSKSDMCESCDATVYIICWCRFMDHTSPAIACDHLFVLLSLLLLLLLLSLLLLLLLLLSICAFELSYLFLFIDQPSLLSCLPSWERSLSEEASSCPQGSLQRWGKAIFWQTLRPLRERPVKTRYAEKQP